MFVKKKILAGEQFCQYDDEDYHMDCFKENIADILIENMEAKIYYEEE